MKFKIDENLPLEVGEILNVAGHDASTVFGEGLAGASDSYLMSVCRSENRALVTLDNDFCNMLVYPPSQQAGIVVIRSGDQSKPALLHLMKRVVSALERQSPEGELWIVEANRIRVREG